MSEFDFDHIMSEISSVTENAIMRRTSGIIETDEIIERFEAYMSREGWKSVSKNVDEDGDITYEANFSVEGLILRGRVILESAGQTMGIMVILPTNCACEYSLIMDEYVASFNYSKKFGSLQHDARDGAVEYSYSYLYLDGFNINVFDKYFNYCLSTAVEAYPDVAKLCVGRLSRRQLAALNEKLNRLVNALKE
jgi:hypothetical protein